MQDGDTKTSNYIKSQNIVVSFIEATNGCYLQWRRPKSSDCQATPNSRSCNTHFLFPFANTDLKRVPEFSYKANSFVVGSE